MDDVQPLEARLSRVLENPLIVPEIDQQREAMLRACYVATPSITPPLLPRQRARIKLLEGVPLLHQEVFDPDLYACGHLFGRMVEKLARLEPRNPPTADLHRSMLTGRLDPIRAADEALAGHPDHLSVLADWSDSPPLLLSGIAALAVRPSLRALASSLAPVLSGDIRWARGYCPICGSRASLTLQRTGDRESDVCCLRCLTMWLVPPSICLSCHAEREQLASDCMMLAVGRVWLKACPACGFYLKVLAPISLPAVESLLAADVDSAPMERLAHERGWVRRSGGAFRLELREEEVDEAIADLLEAD